MKELIQILGQLKRLLNSGESFALATVVFVEGSAYRRPGARMLIDENGNVIWEKGWEELTDIYDLQDKYGEIPNLEEVGQVIDAYPHEGHENILCVIEDVKGTICNYYIESDEVPKFEDFGFKTLDLLILFFINNK